MPAVFRAMSQLIDAEEEDQGWELDAADAEADELCNCRFSLAYGGKILLNNATLRLIRGRRYGLCGGNGVGKSTLMKAIARGQLDGFPPADQLKTVYVEHDIQVGGGTQEARGQQGCSQGLFRNCDGCTRGGGRCGGAQAQEPGPSSQCDVAVNALPGHPAAAVVFVSSRGWPNST
jgi:hypothetical protein